MAAEASKAGPKEGGWVLTTRLVDPILKLFLWCFPMSTVARKLLLLALLTLVGCHFGLAASADADAPQGANAVLTDVELSVQEIPEDPAQEVERRLHDSPAEGPLELDSELEEESLVARGVVASHGGDAVVQVVQRAMAGHRLGVSSQLERPPRRV